MLNRLKSWYNACVFFVSVRKRCFVTEINAELLLLVSIQIHYIKL